jgi:hypothetical protein
MIVFKVRDLLFFELNEFLDVVISFQGRENFMVVINFFNFDQRK